MFVKSMGSVSQQRIMFCCNPAEQNQTMAGFLAMIWAWLRNKALSLTDLYSDCFLMCSIANILHDGEVLSFKAFLEVWGKGGGGSSRMFPLKCYSYIDRSLRRQWKERTRAEMWRCGRAFVSMELPLHFLLWTPTHTSITYKLAGTGSVTNVSKFFHCSR